MPAHRTVFEILWYSGGPTYAPNRCIGRDYVKRADLTDAIKAACNLLSSGGGNSDYAHGMYVRKAEDQTHETTVR